MSLQKDWDLEIDPGVLKLVGRLPRKDALRVLEVIHALPLDPYYGDITKMRGEENAWRRRIGAFRIFYRLLVAEKKVLVFHLERRTSATY